jgi:arsenite methyltransferase
MEAKETPTHETVRSYYAERAVTSITCCGDSDCCETDLYNPDLLSELPQDISGFSLGCGDPISLANLQPAEIVLDLGSGGGLDCFLAAQRVGEQGRVIGVDMTPEMIDRARQAAARLQIQNVEFRPGFLEALPVEDASVDVVISNCVINLSPDKPQVFREIIRTLKPGGRLAVSDIVVKGTLPQAVQKDPQAWSACISGAISAEEYAAGLEEAGFVDVKVQPMGVFDAAADLIPFAVPYSAAITGKKP